MWLEDLDEDSYSFVGADGEIRSFVGPSVLGSLEFAERLKHLGKIADANPSKRGIDLYAIDAKFRWTVDRLLRICHIEPDWCSWEQIERLLFGWIDDVGFHEAILVSIQKLPISGQQSGSESPPTAEDLVGALAASQGGVDAAIALLKNLTPKQLQAILQSQKPKDPVSGRSGRSAEDEGMERLRQHMVQQARQNGDQGSKAIS